MAHNRWRRTGSPAGGDVTLTLQPAAADADTSLMESFRLVMPVSRPAVAVAAAASCAVVGAAVVGAMTPPVVVGGLCAAGLTAALSARGARRDAEPRLFAPLPIGTAPTSVTVVAPRAGDVAGGRTVDHDAA
jgi:hypothetical protein